MLLAGGVEDRAAGADAVAGVGFDFTFEDDIATSYESACGS